jgi:triosephosphate isomerase (TIM)
MKIKSHIIIANWKMYYSYKQVQAWCQENKDNLIQIMQKNLCILCPSYESLEQVVHYFSHSPIKIGGQNCSEYAQGAYTGQVSAQSLHELGSHYCIIGHSEVRKALHETNEHLLRKMEQLLAHSITPIFCIGETKDDFEKKVTQQKIEQQLEPLLILSKNNEKPFTCFIAYEPIWAIGTGIVADNGHIIKSLEIIRKKIEPYKKIHTISLLYGGTVTSQTVPILKEVETIEGFLIGKASTDFQELKKIVSLL